MYLDFNDKSLNQSELILTNIQTKFQAIFFTLFFSEPLTINVSTAVLNIVISR